MQKLSRAFTIIELIVVIAIIAILAAIVMVNVVGYIQKAKTASALANLKQMDVIAANYYKDNNTYDGLCNDTAYTNIQNINANSFGFESEGCADTANSIGNLEGASHCASTGKWVVIATNGPAQINLCVDADGYAGHGAFNEANCNCYHYTENNQMAP